LRWQKTVVAGLITPLSSRLIVRRCYGWADEHEDFRTALSRAKVLEQQWWERAGRSGMVADKFNALVWKTSVQARFRDDYTERKVTEVTGANGGAIKTESVTKIDTRELDENQREALKAALMSAVAAGDK